MPVPPADRRRSPRPSGFTLVELMVVVVLIGILVGLTVTIVPRVMRSARTTQTSAQMAALATAIQAYYNDFRAYPGPIPNSQVGAKFYNYGAAPQSDGVYLMSGTTEFKLELATGTLGSETYAPFGQSLYVTGAENLVLGLLGGLELHLDTNGAIKDFAYSDASIYPDGKTAAPLGPMSLNPNSPKRLGAYIQVKAGDLSNSRLAAAMGSPAPTSFADEAGRTANDSAIPEFVDKFSNPMPILFLRANVGGKAIAGVGGMDDAGTPLKDSNGAPVIPQYDLAQSMGYTQSPTMSAPPIGTNPGDATRDHHGLQGLGTMTDSVMGTLTPASGFYNSGKNGLAYLKDPNNPGTSNTPNYTTSPASFGNARQKDAFILISAGPDGVYGTADDIVYPGGSVTPQQ